jgi:y4mF family transcriptional regulator
MMAESLKIGDLAGEVRARRAELGLTQTQLAELADVSRKWISDVERGKESVQLKPLLQVCDVLGLPITLAEAPPRTRAARHAAADDDEINRRIRTRAERTSFGGKLAQLGITTVALDAEGNLTRYHPDGSHTAVA